MIAPPADRDPDQADWRPWMKKIAAEGGVDAVIDIVGDNAPIWVDVWVIEKSPQRIELWRVAGEPTTANPSERLAIRAIEVLRSSFLESDMSGKVPHHEPIAKRAINTESRGEFDELTRRPERIGFGWALQCSPAWTDWGLQSYPSCISTANFAPGWGYPRN